MPWEPWSARRTSPADPLAEVLDAAGWHAGRRVDVAAWADEITADGLPVSDAAREFWASFGGLTLRRHETVVELDPTQVVGYGHPPRGDDQVFTPIGVHNHTDGLWIGDRGVVLSEFGDEHRKWIAASPREALAVLFFGRPPLWQRRRRTESAAPARFPRRVEHDLRAAGWYPGRRVDTARWRADIDGIEMHPAAERFLTEFGGLEVDICGAGRSAAREPFELDPALCEGEEGRFRDWSARLGRSLYPLGELDGGRFLLGIDSEAELWLVVDWLGSCGVGDAGLIALCEGTKVEEYRG